MLTSLSHYFSSLVLLSTLVHTVLLWSWCLLISVKWLTEKQVDEYKLHWLSLRDALEGFLLHSYHQTLLFIFDSLSLQIQHKLLSLHTNAITTAPHHSVSSLQLPLRHAGTQASYLREGGNEHSFIKVTRLQRTGTWVPYQLAKLKIAGECEEHDCVTGRNWKMCLFEGIQLRNWVRRSPSSYQVLKVVRYFPLHFPHPYYLPSLCLWFQNKQTLTQQLWITRAPQQFKDALL